MRQVRSVGILLLWALATLIGPSLPLAPNQIDLPQILQGPSLLQPLDTDDLGRSVLDRLIVGSRTSFLVAPCLALLLVVLAVNLDGDRLSDRLDVRSFQS